MKIAVFGDIHGHWIDFKESVADSPDSKITSASLFKTILLEA